MMMVTTRRLGNCYHQTETQVGYRSSVPFCFVYSYPINVILKNAYFESLLADNITALSLRPVLSLQRNAKSLGC
jgi:hypothetical protein